MSMQATSTYRETELYEEEMHLGVGTSPSPRTALSGVFRTIQLSDQRSVQVVHRRQPRADHEIALPENYGA
jgi:hypothetical protein